MSHSTNICFAIIVTSLLTVCVGCGPSRPETAPVSGHVTFQGKSVTEGTIVFQPEQGRQAIATIGADGSYTLTTFEQGDGAMLGKHRVTIESRRITVPTLPGEEAGESVGTYGPPKVEWLVPEKFSSPDSSPLKAVVRKGGNSINFDL